MLVTNMITVHVAYQHDIDFTQTFIIGTGHRLACIIEQARSVRVFKNKRPVTTTKLTIVAA
jgi:hypothetical protein